MSRSLVLLLLLASSLAPDLALADDWPQHRGPRRDGVSAETGLATAWPASGPPLLWRASGLGSGWTSAIVAGGRIYVTGNADGQVELHALDLAGKRLWTARLGKAWSTPNRYPGARGNPAVADGRVHVVTGSGEVVAVNAANGKVLWSVDMLARFGGKNIVWGMAEAALVIDGKVICMPGGTKASVAALDAATGDTVWTAPEMTDQVAYGSAIVIEHGGTRQVVAWTARGVVSLVVPHA